MNFKNLSLVGATLLLSANMFATSIHTPTNTYFGGFEDTVSGDNDYNDVVFSLSAMGLTLNSSGKFYAQPALDNSGNPFWNNSSYDVPSNSYNVGYCIYGGGACNNGTALDPGAKFLASSNSPKSSANDVTFSANGTVTLSLILSVASNTDYIGYYTDGKAKILGTAGNTYTFTPGNDAFGLFAYDASKNTYYYSQSAYDRSDDDTSHFAFFSSTAPEPGMMGLVGAGLVSVGAFFRRKKSVQS